MIHNYLIRCAKPQHYQSHIRPESHVVIGVLPGRHQADLELAMSIALQVSMLRLALYSQRSGLERVLHPYARSKTCHWVLDMHTCHQLGQDLSAVACFLGSHCLSLDCLSFELPLPPRRVSQPPRVPPQRAQPRSRRPQPHHKFPVS